MRGLLEVAQGSAIGTNRCPCHEKGGEKPNRFDGKTVIPGRPVRAGPGTHEHRLVLTSAGPCSWLPGSRAKPAPRNDAKAIGRFHAWWRTPACGGSHPESARTRGFRSLPASGARWLSAQPILSHVFRRSRLPAVAQPGGDAVDRQMNPGNHILVRVAGAVTPQQFDLHVIERIKIREAVADRARQ